MIFEGIVEEQNFTYNEHVPDYLESIEVIGYVSKFPKYRFKFTLTNPGRIEELLTEPEMPVLVDTKYGNVEFLQ